MNRFKIVFALLAVLVVLTAPAYASDVEREVKDAWLEGRIVSAYALNDHLSAFDLNVDVEDGVAQIHGVVEGEAQQALAEEIALSVDGVREVKSSVTVDTGNDNEPHADTSRGQAGFAQNVRDATLTASVKTQLLAKSEVDGLDIDVDTENGTVVLQGTVESNGQKDLAEKIATDIEGVRKVDNRLTVGT